MAQAGWYPDPTDPSGLRWFDGTQWTAHVQADPSSQPSAAPDLAPSVSRGVLPPPGPQTPGGASVLQAPPARIGRRRAVIATAALLVVAVVVGAVVVRRGGNDDDGTAAGSSDAAAREVARRSDLGDPDAVDLPAPVDADADATVAWLRGEGAPAMALLTATAPLWRTGADACPTVMDDLQSVGDPTALLAAASATPDATTQELLVNLHAAVRSALVACPDAGAYAPASATFAWHWALAQRRLQQLGVAT